MAMERGAFICDILGEYDISDKCRKSVENLSRHRPSAGGSKQAASLMVCAGLADAEKTNSEILSVGGARGFSTFLGSVSYTHLDQTACSGDRFTPESTWFRNVYQRTDSSPYGVYAWNNQRGAVS